MIERRVAFLTDYQDAAYAKRYTDFVAKVRAAEAAKHARQRPTLTEAVARYYFKLLAIKDEYEVARLYTETDFAQRVAAAVRGRLQAARSTSRRRCSTSPIPRPACRGNRRYGPWMMTAFRVLAKLKGLRGTRARRVRPDRGAQGASAR